MKEKPEVLRTHCRSENSSQCKTLKEKHHQMASNSNRNKYESEKYKPSNKNHPHKSTDKYQNVKESSRQKNYKDGTNYEESYEELSRKKRKIERELHALDLEEAAAKKHKIDKKTSKHQTVRDEDKSSNGGKNSAFEKNSQMLERTFKHKKDKPSSDENKGLASEKNRLYLDRKTSKLKHFRVRDESSSEENKHLASGRDRQKPEKTSRYQKISVKEEPLSEEDKQFESERNRLERRTSRHHNINIKEEPSSDENDLLPAERNRSEPSSKVSKDNEFGSKANAGKDKEKPDFAVSGKLAEDTNVFNGVVIKYNEPSEARKPKRRWRLYPFKGESDLPFIPIHRQSAYLLGRTRAIADIPIDHPSCSKQHAVLQFRLVPYTREDGTKGRRVRPYIIDLESANGTFVNNNRINPRCYVELMEKDVIKFGYSSREYVLLHEESKNDDYDDVRDSS